MRFSVLMLSPLLATMAVFASAPVGSVTSSENFRLSGSEISVNGVPSWPVVAGDQLQTRGSAAMLRLNDGSRIIVGRNSRVSLEQIGSATKIKLISGSLRYSLKRDSVFEVIVNQLSSRTAAYTSGNAWLDGGQGIIAAATSVAADTYIPAPIFRPGPLNLPSGNQLGNSTAPPNTTNPGSGSLLPWLSARP